MKYVIFVAPDEMETVRIFDEITSHNEVRAEVQSGKPGLKVLSAGTVSFQGSEQCHCIRKSVSLGLAFSQELGERDSEIIARFLKLSI